jgi:hypothetical protein
MYSRGSHSIPFSNWTSCCRTAGSRLGPKLELNRNSQHLQKSSVDGVHVMLTLRCETGYQLDPVFRM